MLDKISLGWYKVKCENTYLKLKRSAFQDWFAKVMKKAYQGDFVPIRGTPGDRGCDGYRISKKTVFQVYAPREITASKLNPKIAKDFSTALKEFGEAMTSWTFVHNDPDGLTPETGVDTINGIKTKHPEIKISVFNFNEIWEIIKGLEPEKLADLFGVAPTYDHLHRLQLNEIVPVIKFIERGDVPIDVPVDLPNLKKLEFNDFSIEVCDLLRNGQRKAVLVQRYMDSGPDPMLGESLAESFRKKYSLLKKDDLLTANEIFDELRKFTGGDHFQTASEQAAVLAVLFYFFERCDIFENTEAT